MRFQLLVLSSHYNFSHLSSSSLQTSNRQEDTNKQVPSIKNPYTTKKTTKTNNNN